MKKHDKIFLVMNIIALLILMHAGTAVCQDSSAGPTGSPKQGTSSVQPRPNSSGGYDFYDSSGKKTGSSSKRTDGGYDYYDTYGNSTGSLRSAEGAAGYQYYDADGLSRGTVSKDPYGGYRYYEQKEGLEGKDAMSVQKNYEQKDPYATDIEILTPQQIQGKKQS